MATATVVPAEASARAAPGATPCPSTGTPPGPTTPIATVLFALIPRREASPTAATAAPPPRTTAIAGVVRLAPTTLRPDEEAKDHRRVGATREAEGQPEHLPATELVVLLGGPDSKVERAYDRRASLRLQLEARDIRELKVIRPEPHALKHALEERPLFRINDPVESLAR